MNQIYHIIWSHVSRSWVVVSEAVVGRGKVHSRRHAAGATGVVQRAAHNALLRPLLLLVQWLVCLPTLAQLPAPTALPTGGTVSAGQATISQSGNQMQILQGSDKAALNWQSFNIGSNAGVIYRQPSTQSVALNRVAGNDPSQIFGTLSANGKVILINPNGVVFGAGSRVDVGGLIATTKALSDADFMNGQYHFLGGGSGVVRNDGTLIAAPDGAILMVADQVINTGTMRVSGGSVGMVSADQLQVSADWKSVSVVQSSAATINTVTVENVGTIDVSGAQGGRIVLQGGQGTTQSEGQLLATGSQGGGGVIHLSGMQVGLMRGSLTDASGAGGGGEVLVGGDWQGSGSMAHASATYMDADAVVKVNATAQGNGGKAVLWSDGYTNFRGHIEANGAGSGNGGMVETSGKDTLDAFGKVTAEGTHAGMWLLDPADVTITSAPGDPLPNDGYYAPTGTTGTIANTVINDALNNGTSVTISTTGSTATRLGHLVQNADADILKEQGGDATLTLIASLDLALMGNVRSTAGKLNLVLDASGGAGNGAGGILVYKDIATNGGTLEFRSGVYAGGSSSQVFMTSGGAVTFGYDLLLADGLTINTVGLAGAGAVAFNGRIDSGDRYEIFDTPVTWEVARDRALNGTGGGAAVNDSYLATPLSAFQNLIINRTAGFASGTWLGGQWQEGIGWVWTGGIEKGTVFNRTRTGIDTPAGVYENWNRTRAGTPPLPQPNNSGGNQTVLQLFGVQSAWNDYSITSTYGYVQQINLAASPLDIKATGANVTFGGAVGGLKPLSSLSVDGFSHIHGGEVITELGQSYHSPITILGASTLLQSTQDSLMISQPIVVAQTIASTLNISAARNVATNALTAFAGGPLSVNIKADSGDLGVGTVTVNGAVNTQGGTVTLTASSGIALNGVMDAGDGNITLTSSNSGNIVAAPGMGINTTGNIDVTNGVSAGVPGTGLIALDSLAGDRITIASNFTGLVAGVNAIALNGPVNGNGNILVTSVTGDILIGNDMTSAAPGNASAILIGAASPNAAGNGAGGNVKLAGNSRLRTAATSRAIIYTGSITGSTGMGQAGYPQPENYRFNTAFGDTSLLDNATGVYVQYRDRAPDMMPNGMGGNSTSPESNNLDLLASLIAFDDIRQQSAQADYFLHPGEELRNSSTHAVLIRDP